MGFYVRVTKESLPGLLERLKKETSVRWAGGDTPEGINFDQLAGCKYVFFDSRSKNELTKTAEDFGIRKGDRRLPNHTAFIREVAKVCPPEGVKDSDGLYYGKVHNDLGPPKRLYGRISLNTSPPSSKKPRRRLWNCQRRWNSWRTG
jgi:hypothetical protein